MIHHRYLELDAWNENAMFIEDAYVVKEKIEQSDFGSGNPLVLGSSREQDAVKKIDGLLIEIGTIATEEALLNRTYSGTLTFIEKIYTAAMGGS